MISCHFHVHTALQCSLQAKVRESGLFNYKWSNIVLSQICGHSWLTNVVITFWNLKHSHCVMFDWLSGWAAYCKFDVSGKSRAVEKGPRGEESWAPRKREVIWNEEEVTIISGITFVYCLIKQNKWTNWRRPGSRDQRQHNQDSGAGGQRNTPSKAFEHKRLFITNCSFNCN